MNICLQSQEWTFQTTTLIVALDKVQTEWHQTTTDCQSGCPVNLNSHYLRENWTSIITVCTDRMIETTGKYYCFEFPRLAQRAASPWSVDCSVWNQPKVAILGSVDKQGFQKINVFKFDIRHSLKNLCGFTRPGLTLIYTLRQCL